MTDQPRKFTVRLYQRVVEEALVDIEAADEESAKDAAVEQAMRGAVTWHYFDLLDSPIEAEVKP